jgi:hypothetical protein
MVCVCCAPAPPLCACDDQRTSNCTYTATVPGLPLSMSVSCSSLVSSTFIQTGEGRWFNVNVGVAFDQFLSSRAVLSLVNCPFTLPTVTGVNFGLGINASRTLSESQSCSVADDSQALASGNFHLTLLLQTEWNGWGVGRNGGTSPSYPGYLYLWQIVIDPVTNEPSLQLRWTGNIGDSLSQKNTDPCTGLDLGNRCLPCLYPHAQFSGCTIFGGVHKADYVPPPSVCPPDVTLETPTITIACPP